LGGNGLGKSQFEKDTSQTGGFFVGKMQIETRIGPGTQEKMSSFYTRYYVSEKQDSPNKSRVSLRGRLQRASSSHPSGALVLDMGAGRQVLEKEYAQAHGRCDLAFISVDIASISRRHLLASTTASHVRASGAHLPFDDGVFDIAVSGMALDFMPPEAITEAYRVLVNRGGLLLNLHHPSLISEKLDDIAKRKSLSQRTKDILAFFKYLRDHSILLENITEIQQVFGGHGFEVERVAEASDSVDRWWEVDMRKMG